MGCPDAYVALSEAYRMGRGVSKNFKKSVELLKKAADLGSPKGAEFYGAALVGDYDSKVLGQSFPTMAITKNHTMLAEGRKYLYKAFELGNGATGIKLYYTYLWVEKDIELMIKSLRSGAKLGNAHCLLKLESLYISGYYGQHKDIAYASCFRKLNDSIDGFYEPKPIPNFDKLCPLKPILPFKNLLGGK